MQILVLTTYTVKDLKDGLRIKGLKVGGLKADLVRRLANARAMPSNRMFELMVEYLNKYDLKPPIQAIVTEDALLAWMAACRHGRSG